MNGKLFSIVVPTCGRSKQLLTLLERLRPERQGISAAEYDVIVSDDAVRTETPRLREMFPTIQFVSGPGRGPAANRNSGARHSRARWLVFTDDDCEPADGWLKALRTAMMSGLYDVIEGKVVAPDRRLSVFRRDVENLTGGCFWSANLAIQRDLFDRVGGFDEDFREAGGEDMEFAHRCLALGARTTFCSEPPVYHPSHIMTWRDVIRFAFRIRWHALYLLKTGQTVPLREPLWKGALYSATARLMHVVRTTWRTLHVPAAAGSPTGRIALEWLLLPVVLPYFVVWDLRFRLMLRRRS